MLSPYSIHLFKNKDSFLLFHYPSYSLISLNSDIGNIIKEYLEGLTIDDISQNNHVNKKYINNTITNLDLIFEKNISQIRKNKDKDDRVDRITLHISNDCNLRCKYCYANGGSYRLKRQTMSTETAESFVSFCIKNFSDIRKIVFFGGEPCLNIGAMELICKRFKELYLERKVGFLPKFVIITNGTIINDRLLELIRKYISYITVSIDGKDYLNDYNRKDKQGNGTFARIAKFIDTIKSNTNVRIQYEATYTDYHINEHVSKNDIAVYLKERFGINGFVVNELSVKETEEQLSVENINNLPEGFTDILQALSVKEPLKRCSISLKQFAVSTSGLIFPCHMDVGNIGLNLGHIAKRNIFNDISFSEKIKMRNHIEDNSDLCPTCWAQNLCEGCPRFLFYDEERKQYLEHPDPIKCESQRKHIEKILALITNLRADKKQWNRYVKTINNLK